MGFARMTALSAVTALVGASGLYATAAPVAGQERRVIIERGGNGPDRIIVRGGQDDAQEQGGRASWSARSAVTTGPASTSSAWAARGSAWSSATSRPPT